MQHELLFYGSWKAIMVFFHLPFLKTAQDITAPRTQLMSREADREKGWP